MSRITTPSLIALRRALAGLDVAHGATNALMHRLEAERGLTQADEDALIAKYGYGPDLAEFEARHRREVLYDPEMLAAVIAREKCEGEAIAAARRHLRAMEIECGRTAPDADDAVFIRWARKVAA